MWESLIEWGLQKLGGIWRWFARKLPLGLSTWMDTTLDKRYLEHLTEEMDKHLRGVRIHNIEEDYIIRTV